LIQVQHLQSYTFSFCKVIYLLAISDNNQADRRKSGQFSSVRTFRQFESIKSIQAKKSVITEFEIIVDSCKQPNPESHRVCFFVTLSRKNQQ